MDNKTKDMLLSAYNSYLIQFDNNELEPKDKLLEYDFQFLDGKQWRVSFAEFIVKEELRELTNLLNSWHQGLKRWHAWNNVIGAGFDDLTLWMLRLEFLEATAHDCLLKPSSIRDTITSVATASLHQIRLSTDSAYKDHLDTDTASVTGPQKKYPTRKEKEQQLIKIAAHWPNGGAFTKELTKLNSPDYKRQTADYRNLHSHTIGPRLGIGETQFVKRSIGEAEELVDNEDGTAQWKKIPGKLSVIYSFGGTPPLDLDQAKTLNLVEFKQALNCYARYISLCKEAASSLRERCANVDNL